MTHTPSPERAVHPHRPLGLDVLRAKRSVLAFGALSVTAFFVCMPMLPASADYVQETVEASAPAPEPAYVAPDLAYAGPEAPVREDYTVTHYSVVRYPIGGDHHIISAFGARAIACSGCSAFHSGTDFAGGSGTPVYAMADGVVTQVGPDGSLGNYLKIQHVIDGQTITTTYAHLLDGSMGLHVGDAITVGQQVGLVGMTGAATAPHLHFEVRLGGIYGAAVNPLPWLASHVNG